MLSDGLKDDIAELTSKLKNVQIEIDDIKSHIKDEDESTKHRKIQEQMDTLEMLNSDLAHLKLKLQDLENLAIEGFTDAEIIELREVLDKVYNSTHLIFHIYRSTKKSKTSKISHVKWTNTMLSVRTIFLKKKNISSN